MRHNKQKNSSFGRHRGPRKALIRGLVNSLVEQERIKTTVTKAKCIRPLIEKAITIGKAKDVHSRRLLFSRYPNKNTVDKIMKNLSPRFKDRPGGYTRIIKLGYRSGDQAPLAYLEFVDYNEEKIQKQKAEKPKKTEKKEAKEKQEKPPKSTSTKKAKVSAIKDKKQKKKLLAKIDKKRKKARLQQKKSRRINR